LAVPQTQFNDHISEALDAYARKLREWPSTEDATLEEEINESAGEHGLQR
jgi:hypothetical protein